ncbi:TPA: hypothetical protein ACX6O9_000974 [Photobacterium damselae]
MGSIYKGWYHFSDSDTTIVFVHGLFSDSQKCWFNNKTDVFWPELIKSDCRFGNPSIYMAEFYTTPTSRDYKVTDCSDEVFKSLSVRDEQSSVSVLDKKNIVFVGHSTGGIIIRHLLESKQDVFVGKNIGVALYASPSLGSKWASIFSIISSLMNNRLCKELQWGSQVLDDLDDRFKELIDSGKLNIRGFEAYENKPPFIGMPKVVNKLSAGRYFSKPKNVPNTDHSSIVKPSAKSDASHEWLVLFFQQNNTLFINEESDNAIKLSNYNTSNTDGALFEFFNPSNEQYYLERDFDTQLESAIKNNHIWLCGPTGVGKTVALQRAIYKSKVGFKFISLGACVSGTLNDLLMDILLGLCPDLEVTDSQNSHIIREIAEKIRNHCKNSNLILLIEEIPITDQDMFEEFSRAIFSILVSLRGVMGIKFILSSIYEPADVENTELEKISESFKVIKGEYWTDQHIEDLVSIIKKSINTLVDVNEDVGKFAGSPRKAKKYYRECLEQKKIRA